MVLLEQGLSLQLTRYLMHKSLKSLMKRPEAQEVGTSDPHEFLIQSIFKREP
ncbi:hypothetical protein DPMN_074382 [Dreissena polymorpha]|uniref:Uncharacterized protein n=1 Tax=Dreissena polymorpha TaxID=45954 RepID=A0A9D3YEW7_DREPO|nr:hypothetical protein DPMN_074382 [Dreissena polymorpha]